MSEGTKASKGQLSIKTMFNNAHPQTNGTANDAPSVPVQKVAKGKSKALEDIYQKKTQLEHILLRPDTYIGSVEAVTENTWIFDKENEVVLQREVTYVPGLYKIFDEILVNAADHKQRDEKMDTIKIDINQEDNVISIWNNGKGIPVEKHKTEQMYVPTMIFGHLLTSSNYDDEEQKVTGGRNGYGAKLCNIFSTKFVVETGCKDYKRSFKQAWANNMSKTSDPKVKSDYTGPEFTKITFSPDLAKFKMAKLDDDIVSLMSRRAYDIAASARGVKVFLNGKRVNIKNFKDYVDLFLKDKVDEDGNQVKCVYENVNARWEVAVALSSDKGFQQMSFVNSIATTKGGRHVDYVTDMIVKNLVDALKKKNKSGVNIKPFQIKNHMWVFVNCLIVNPTFDSQTKENMTLQAKSFGSKCNFTEKFINSVSKCGIVEAIMMWAKFKQQQQLQSKCAGKKQNKIKGIPKLEDANDAGTRFSSECTLILTEGDSAKTLAVSGLGVVGRDRYGVFPLKGKLLNVREASHKQILENAEINNIIKIIGLQYKKKYDNQDDVKSLRYGKLMIMTDQDQDGSHIKGLLINFIHHNWPTLLRQSFLEEFITPIVKASKGTKEELSFYSLPEFEEWKKSKDNWHTYKIKYYKGLGTSTSKEAKEYFQDMIRHRIIFKHDGAQDDHSINMAFSKKAVDQRKEWLTAWMLECKRRKELGLSDIYLYEKNTRSINYSDFVNKELVLFSNLDNERSIPCLVDGLKPGQRKVLFTCLKRNDKREIKVAQLAGSVAEHSAYHHGEASLMSTIIGLAQNYVGSNNINLLKPVGQFGTRLQGGKDAASPRYIFTQLSSLTKFLFHPHDEPILTHLKDDNLRIEPEWYIPIIPMVLVNGAEGIGTGWSTKIPNFNPREIVENVRRMMRGEEMLPMKPWYKNFLGTIDELDYQRYVVSGEAGRLSHGKYEITELPVRTWTQHYKETVMEPLFQGSEKSPALISDYKEYHTDITVRFLVTVPESKIDKIDEEGPHKVFKLQSTIALSSMVLFDHNGCLKKYESVADILQEFYDLRLKYYGKRKAYLVGMLEAEANKLSNQARFILEKCDGRLTIENKKKKDMISELQRKGYDSDPIKIWKKAFDREALLEEADADEEEEAVVDDKADYDYLLGMAMWCLTKEKKDELLKNKDEKLQELETLKKKSPSNLWEDDLDAFIEELNKVEQQEREDDAGTKSKKAGAKFGGGGGKRKKIADEVLPSPMAERIAPKIDPELRKKAEKAAQAKEKGKKVKKEVVDNDEFDDLVNTSTGKSLADRVGGSPDQIVKGIKKEKKEKKLKQTKLSFSPKKLTVDTSDEDEALSDAEDFDSSPIRVEPRERAGGRRAAAAKVKYQFSDEESDGNDSDLSLHSNDGVNEPEQQVQHMSFDDSIAVNQSGSEADESIGHNKKTGAVNKKPKENNKNAEGNKITKPKANGKIKANDKKSKSEEIEISDTDSEFEDKRTKSKPLPPKPVEKPSASDMFDSLLGSNSPSKSNDTTPEKPAPSKKRAISSSESEGESLTARIMKNYKQKETKKPAKVAKKSEPKEAKKTEVQTKAPIKRGPKKTAAAKRKANSDSDSDDIFEDEKRPSKPSKEDMEAAEVARRAAGGRNKKNVKYNFGSDDSDEDF